MTGCTDRTAYPKPWLSCHIPNKIKKFTTVVQMVTSTRHVPDTLHQAQLRSKAPTIAALRGFKQQSSPRTGCTGTPKHGTAAIRSRVQHEGWSLSGATDRHGHSAAVQHQGVQAGLGRWRRRTLTNRHSQPCSACAAALPVPAVPPCHRAAQLTHPLIT